MSLVEQILFTTESRQMNPLASKVINGTDALPARTDEILHERLLLRTLIDNLPDGIYAKDTAGRKTLANPADLKHLRCKIEAEAIGKTDFDFFPPEIAKNFMTDDQKVFHGEPVINREEYFFDEDRPETLAVDQQVAIA